MATTTMDAPAHVAVSADERPPSLPVRAGPVTAIIDDGGLRDVRVGGREAIRRIYIAVRDRNWGTVPARVRVVRTEIEARSFLFECAVIAQEREIDFRWRATIAGDADGRIRFTMSGVAHSDFLRNRIGFCVLHPAECKGGRCRVRRTGTAWEARVFPDDIAPRNPFTDLSGIAHEVEPDVWCRLEFEGDRFETEDQRNWTDASFKTFCTPLHRPYPVAVVRGTIIEQSILLSVDGTSRESVRTVGPHEVQIQILPDSSGVPAIGLGLARAPAPLTASEQARLRALRPAHLRLDLFPAAADFRRALDEAGTQAHALGCPLEIALHLDRDPAAEVAAVAAAFESRHLPVCRWLILHQREKSATHARWVELAREKLGRFSPAPFGSGTDFFFNELNQNRPPTHGLDFISLTINPQVHAFDEISMVETLAMQREVVEGARKLAGGVPVSVSPITLKMRSNPVATAAGRGGATGEFPPEVDVRQPSLFTAAWTLGSIRELAAARTAAITYFETTGWRGVMEAEGGSPRPDRFPSRPGMVFPVYHVIADVNAFAGGRVIHTRSDDPLSVAALVLDGTVGRRVLVANFTAGRKTVRLSGMMGGATTAALQRLDRDSLELATMRPETFRAATNDVIRATDDLVLELNGWERLRLDIRADAMNLPERFTPGD